MKSNVSGRRIIIGLDGMPYRLIKHLAESNVMPNTGAIIKQGVFKEMESSIPEISSVAWSSIITGANPGCHGIFGFTDIPMGTYRLSFPNFTNLKATPFWKREREGRSVIINVPFTYPAASLNGVLIAGFVALDLSKATYPPSLVPRLKKMNYQIDVDSGKAHKSLDLFLKDLNRTLQSRIEAYRYLWAGENWQTFVIVFTGTDRLAHFLWDAYEDDFHKHHLAFLDHLHQIDGVIGEINNQIEEEDSLILLSDHGFELLERDIHINFFLHQQGFLTFKKEPPDSYADIDSGTKAFALDPARIYINLKGKYPRGSVNPEDGERLIEELQSSFNSLEIEGKKVVNRICRKEEIYQGAFLHQAPDLVLLSNSGFNLKADLKAKALCGKSIFTGKHTQRDAFLLIKEPSEDIIPSKPCVSDVVGIMDRLKEKYSVC